MFTRSTEEVKARLVTMCRSVEERMANKAEEVWSAMNRDYTQVVSGKQLPEGQLMPKWERQLRSEVAKVIEHGAKSIEKIYEEPEVPTNSNKTSAIKNEETNDNIV